MITPLVQEETWLAMLGDVPPWTFSPAPVVVVAPHPDDETLAAGGLIAALREQGVTVTVVAVTDGENAYADYPGLGAVRTEEQAAALGCLGVPAERIVRLHLPDSSVAAHGDALVEALRELVRAETHVLAPWSGDFHPDHEASGQAAEQVAREKGAVLSSWLFWSWHRGTPELMRTLPMRRFPLSAAQIAAKAAALACHRSQLDQDAAHTKEEPILPASLLGPARREFEIFLDGSR